MTFLRTRLYLGALATVALVITAAPAVVRAQDTTATIHYKGITLQPVGFAAAEGVWRQKNEEADIGSSYSAIPFSGTSAGETSELRMTGRQSRFGMLATTTVDDWKYAGFFESDFLGVGTSSNSTESNSYVLRVRQFFGQAQSNGWTIDAGQMWTFLTTDKTGLLPRSEEVPLTIEAQYAVGFNWARQMGVRVSKKMGDNASAGISLEAPQTTLTSSNAPGNILLGLTGGSTLNSTANYSADYAPDLIGKIAFDPAGWGHWELKAIGSIYRDRVVDPATATLANASHNMNSAGGGVGFGIFLPVKSGGTDMVDLGLSGLWGQGIGRYGTSQFADVTIKSDSSLSPLQEGQALFSIEAHPMPKLDVYGYAGAEYAGRDSYVNAAGKGVGYGSPLNSNAGCGTEAAPTGQYAPAAGTCTGQNRAIYGGNIGFWYRFYKGVGGTVQWGLEYSYTSRNVWADAAGNQPQAIENMLFSSFRYVLP